MNDRVIDAPPARKVFHANPLAAAVVPLLFAMLGGGLAWLTEGRVFAQWVCIGIAVFAVIDQIQLRLRPPLEIDGDQVTVRPRGGGTMRFGGRSVGAVELRSHGIFGRGVALTPGPEVGRGATPDIFIGPLRDPAGAWHALDRLRRTGGQ